MDGTNGEAAGFKLSPQQQQLLAGARAGAGEVAQCAVLLDGPVDVEDLRQALLDVVARHEILRTTFVRPAGMRVPQQTIGEDPAAAVSLTQAALDWPAGEDDPAALERLMRDEARRETQARRETDPASGPTARALLAGEGEKQLLLLTVHAACADATSLLALVRELCESYSGVQAPEEPVQYADYAEWRHELIAEGEPEAQKGLAYWRQAAAERPNPPRILFAGQMEAGGARPGGTPPGGTDPDDTRPSGAHPVAGPNVAALDLGKIRLGELQGAAVGAGASVAVFLEAAWHALLARLSGTSELLVAGWCDGRAQPDLAQAVGAYEQPTPIHSRFQETTSFAEIIDQVRRSRVNAVRCQDCAIADDLGALLDQAAAGWTFHAVGPLAAPARRLLALRPAAGGARLTLALRAGGEELAGEILYDPRTVPAQDAEELADRFATLLGSALADPSAPVAQLAIMDGRERQRMLDASGLGAVSGEAVTLVHELLERQARLTPDRPAVVASGPSLTYAELDADANRLARHLELLGPVRQQTVGLCMERTPAMLVAVMAILKAGGSYLPLNYEHPRARIAHQLRETGAQIVLTEQHLLEHMRELDATFVCVDRDAEEIAAHSAESLGRLSGHEDLVYVMYTSGSTGTPKGVAVTHGNLAGYAASIATRLAEEGDLDGAVFGVVSAISTDLGNTSIYAPLACGGTIRLVSADAAMDGELLVEELAGERLDALKIAPSHLRALLAAGQPGMLPTRWLIVGGEALSWELVDQVRSLSPTCRILNHYGPTETTVGCATYAVDERERADALTVPIGFPLAGGRAYVLDRRSEPVPVGVPGELCIAGAGVAAGYIGRPEEDGGFTADPFGPDGGRMYRTGDRVRLLRDGAIEFLGRLDDQVKIRGFRVQPGEVEATLRSHRAIRGVAVCAEADHRGALRLAAYIVSSEPPAVEELRTFLAETLPDHMIPTAFSTIEALPLTASGKIDRGALAGLGELQAKREAEYVAPRDAVEQQISEIWAELLGVERVGAEDDFFALGGHSLLATQATMRIRRLYGDIPLRALLAAPTVAALADVVRARGDAAVAAR
jgi:amino acid adenylation domain-containing protein